MLAIMAKLSNEQAPKVTEGKSENKGFGSKQSVGIFD